MTLPDPTTAALFRSLHAEGLLLLANAWDAGSARLIESLGAKAIATTSAGLAWAHGYADGDHLPVPVLANAVAEITRVIHVPLSVDIEGGYSDDPAGIGETIVAVVNAGAVGINIEDGTGAPDRLAAKIGQAKQSAARLGVDLFVNARTDVYLRGLVPKEDRIRETLARASRYRAAGADSLFVPGVADATEIRAIAAEAGLPLNVLAWPGLPSASELAGLGVRRLSTGSGIAQAALGRTAALTTNFLRDGASGPLSQEVVSYPEMNGLLSAR